MKSTSCFVALASVGLLLVNRITAELNSLGQEIYEYDVSWPIRSSNLSSQFGDKQGYYDDFMNKCRTAAGENMAMSVCDDGDAFRMKMNTYQPMSMRNYTALGFKKIRAPEAVFALIKEFWDANRHLHYSEWKSLTTYHNHWDSPTTVISIENETLTGGGSELRSRIWEASKVVMEEWTGQRLAPCSLYGIRLYHDNAVLAPHVDRNPLVTSAIINVDQDVREPWPLEVWGHDGKPYNITMEPGDMVLYESHSILHGRPFPLQGNFYANIFVHFEPVGALTETGEVFEDPGKIESIAAGLPPYVIPGSFWEQQWRDSNPHGWSLTHSDPHVAAKKGNVPELQLIAAATPSKLHKADKNGWQPIHEAARSGELGAVDYLLKMGARADVKEGKGPSALEVAETYLGAEHEVYSLLHNSLSRGGLMGDDL